MVSSLSKQGLVGQAWVQCGQLDHTVLFQLLGWVVEVI